MSDDEFYVQPDVIQARAGAYKFLLEWYDEWAKEHTIFCAVSPSVEVYMHFSPTREEYAELKAEYTAKGWEIMSKEARSWNA